MIKVTISLFLSITVGYILEYLANCLQMWKACLAVCRSLSMTMRDTRSPILMVSNTCYRITSFLHIWSIIYAATLPISISGEKQKSSTSVVRSPCLTISGAASSRRSKFPMDYRYIMRTSFVPAFTTASIRVSKSSLAMISLSTAVLAVIL